MDQEEKSQYQELRDQYIAHTSLPKHQRCLCEPGFWLEEHRLYGYITIKNICPVAEAMLKAIGDLFGEQNA